MFLLNVYLNLIKLISHISHPNITSHEKYKFKRMLQALSALLFSDQKQLHYSHQRHIEKQAHCYGMLQITTNDPIGTLTWIFDSSMNMIWKEWNTKEGIQYYQGACSSPSFFYFMGIFCTFKGISPPPLLISSPANKIQIVIHPIFVSTMTQSVRPS